MRYSGLLFGFCFFILVFLFCFLNVFYSNILDIKVLGRNQNKFLSQGWGFFTKSPRDVRTAIYHKGCNIMIPFSRAENLFGIKRHTSRKIYEVGLLLKSIKDDKWRKTTRDTFIGEHYNIRTSMDNPQILGELIVVNTERTPWAWAKYQGDLGFYRVYLKLNVTR